MRSTSAGTADVRLDGKCRTAERRDLGHGGLGALAVGVVVDGDVAAVAREFQSDAFADSLAGAGDEGDFGIESQRHVCRIAVPSKGAQSGILNRIP